jgi:surface polysaccharide O-acyltransferase-like enzyme
LHILILILFVAHRFYGNIEINPISLILNITLTQAWYPPVSNDFNGVAWFLSVIVVIYFLVPFTVNFMSKKNLSQLLIMLAVIFFFRLLTDSVIYRIFPEQLIMLFYFNPLYRYTDFLFGFIGALIVKKSDLDNEERPKFFSAVQIFFIAIYIIGSIFFSPRLIIVGFQ